MSHYTWRNDECVGRRVRIKQSPRYGGRCIGQSGTIKSFWGTENVGVDVDFMVNENSKMGLYYFKLTELEYIEDKPAIVVKEGEKAMLGAKDYLNIAKIHFHNNDDPVFRTYECANYIPDLMEGDTCVVMSANHGMGLALVIEILPNNGQELFREVVTKVDMSEYEARVATREKAAELKAKMQERAKQLQDIVLYQTLAKEDPIMAQFLQDYKTLIE